MAAHRVYLIPGMFGFGRLATYDYFAHVERALVSRFADAGERLETFTVDVAPTASIRRRAVRLAELVAQTSSVGEDDACIHILGHSTGGLDARLVASPSADLRLEPSKLSWVRRLRSVTTMNAPHYGTPLASFFATVSGQRMLYAVSALTFIGLSLGAPPLSVASALVMAIGRLDGALGFDLGVLDRASDALLRALEPATSDEVRLYLDAIRKDQGAVIQVTPEAMDLFVAGVEDRAGVLYQSTCAMAPAPSPAALARSLANPWRAISSTLFATLYGITARADEQYPCASPEAPDAANEAKLVSAFGRSPGIRANDGVVPLRSQVWGRVVWAGYGDHLDVLGHFADDLVQPRSLLPDFLRGARVAADADTRHADWLRSGANFDRRAFGSLMDAVAEGMLS